MDNGFAVIHANRLEDLTALTVDWIRRHPLPPLTDDVFLVESNGIAQWLKLALADDDACGIAAAQQFQMPSRFLWQAYRTVLGEQSVPRTSPFDKSRLLWRLMRLLPSLKKDSAFEPLQRFLAEDDDLRKRFQLSERLADLYDQYQVYRADWLAHWEAGHDTLPEPGGEAQPLEEQRWQAILWRTICDDMGPEQKDSSRASIHARFLDALRDKKIHGQLPPRIVVFGISALPRQTLEALHALSPHCQILLLVQNPSEHYWGDIVEDRELLRRQQQRHRAKPSLEQLDSHSLALAANPLLASWGKQGRDYINLLYSFDAPEEYQGWFQTIDLFQPPTDQLDIDTPLLTQVQQDIFSLENAGQNDPRPLPENDSSIAFHVAHSPQREVEILHDQLLHLFDQDDTLTARDVIVMVPDIQRYAPHIDAVFGGINQEDARHIPYTISDRSQQYTRPLAGALAQLLNAPTLRYTVSDILDLLDVPAIRSRFDIDVTELPLLHQWSKQAGIRWGFDAEHRASLGLPDQLHHNSWLFGLSRMLLGYASGQSPAWEGIEPFDEVAGLSAQLAGKLAAFIQALQRHWAQLCQPAAPATWQQQLIQLLDDLALASEEDDVQLMSGLIDALEQWRQSCDEARFDDEIPVAVVRSVLLGAIDQGSLSQRFLAGRVNFCTLMPMRSIPFRVVCLLGMNDGDYPRSHLPMDFDLMAGRHQYRPGDRSRREDDRYLFLEALLSARDRFYVSWVGRNIRDNAETPPSVLVAQLRDYLEQGWVTQDGNHTEGNVLPALTTEHPLQPFSRDYFNGPAKSSKALFTYASEWRDALEQQPASAAEPLPLPDELMVSVTPAELGHFLQQPTGLFYSERLKIRILPTESITLDEEPFALDPLARAGINRHLLKAALNAVQAGANAEATIQDTLNRLCSTGQLPPAPWDQLHAQTLATDIQALASQWHHALDAWPEKSDMVEVDIPSLSKDVPFSVEGWLIGLHQNGNEKAQLMAYDGDIKDKPWRLIDAWVNHLCANSQGLSLTSWMISPDISYELPPLDETQAIDQLRTIAQAWVDALRAPLPLSPRTGFAFLNGKAPSLSKARSAYDGSPQSIGERDYDSNLMLRRSFPSFDALSRETDGDEIRFARLARELYGPLLQLRKPLTLGGEA